MFALICSEKSMVSSECKQIQMWMNFLMEEVCLGLSKKPKSNAYE